MANKLSDDAAVSAAIPRPDPVESAPVAESRWRRWRVVIGLFFVVILSLPAWRHGVCAWHFHQARRALDRADFPAATEAIEKALRVPVRRAEMTYWHAVAMRRGEVDLDKVMPALDEAERLGWAKEAVDRQKLLFKAQLGSVEDVVNDLLQGADRLDNDQVIETYEAISKGHWLNNDPSEALKALGFWIESAPNDPRPRLMRAEIYSKYTDPVSTEREYRDILDFDERNVIARRLLARLLLEKGQIEDAREQFSYCLDHDPKNRMQNLQGLAECAFRSSEVEQAEEWLGKIDAEDLEKEPVWHADVLRLRAEIARLKQDHPSAIALLKEALRIWPHDTSLHQSIAQSYSATGEKELARQHMDTNKQILQRAQRFDDLLRESVRQPKNAELCYQIAVVLEEQEMRSESYTWLLRAVRNDPYHLAALDRLVEHYQQNDVANLEEQYRSRALIALGPTFVRAWAALRNEHAEIASKFFDQLRRHPEAALPARLIELGLWNKDRRFPEVLAALKEMPPDNLLNRPYQLVLEAEALIGLGRPLEAESRLLEAVQISPDMVDADRWLAVIYFDLGDMDRASVHLELVSNLDPTDYRPQRLLGVIHKDYGNHDRAIEHYQNALSRAPMMPVRKTVMLELAECLVRRRRFDEALQALTEAEKTPARDALEAECLMSMGEEDQAIELLDLVLTGQPKNLQALLLRSDLALLKSDPAHAAELLKRAVAAAPFDHGAHHRYAQVLARTGEQEQANAELKRAEELRDLLAKFTELHHEVFQRPYDIQLRRELADVALKVGRPDLAKQWTIVAQQMESSQPGGTPTNDPTREMPPEPQSRPSETNDVPPEPRS